MIVFFVVAAEGRVEGEFARCEGEGRVRLLQFVNQLLYTQGRYGIQRRGRFIHQQDFRLHGYCPRYDKTLLLAQGQNSGIFSQLILHLIPQGSETQRVLYHLIQIPAPTHPANPGP